MRCAVHDLACGPDGRCVLCRRSLPPPGGVDGGDDGPKASTGLKVAFGIVAIGLLAVATVGVVDRIRTTEEKLASAPSALETASVVAQRASSTPAITDRPTQSSGLTAQEAHDLEEQIKAAERDLRITVYTTSWCAVCKKLRAWLSENGIRYSERDIDRDPAALDAWKRLSNANEVPLVDIEGNVNVGFDAAWMLETRHRLASARVQASIR